MFSENALSTVVVKESGKVHVSSAQISEVVVSAICQTFLFLIFSCQVLKKYHKKEYLSAESSAAVDGEEQACFVHISGGQMFKEVRNF